MTIFSYDTRMILDSLGVNDAWACWISIHLLKEYGIENPEEQSIKWLAEWLNHKYEQSDYDDFEE